jgi:UDP-glucuronate decarboxylase
MKTILIAGGSGFIGSNLCIRLLKDNNNKVICVDNLYSSKIENVKTCIDNENFKFIHHNIIEPLHIDEEIDEIYHLACPASPPIYQKDPIYTLKTNFIGTMNLLELARIKSAKILLASTSEIYGEPLVSPQPETYRGNVNTTGIRSCYDEGKRIAETLFMDYHNHYNVQTRIVRVFNTYGPNMDKCDGRVITNFISQILNNEHITIYGDGSQTRSFQYIDDLLNGIMKLMDSEYVYPINIGNPNEITIKQLAYILIELTGSSSKFNYKDLPLDDPTNRNPDIKLAKNILNWEPIVELRNGLTKTIKHLQNF